jgi:hypothetical protein
MGESSVKSRTAAARAVRHKIGVPGGRRGAIEEAKMVDAVEYLLLHRVNRDGMTLALAKDFGRPAGTPVPLTTIDDYIARVKTRWQAETRLTRDETRERQLRRLYKRLGFLQGAQKYREAADLEDLIAKIEGNFAPKQIIASTPPNKPLEVKVIDPRKMSQGARQRRIAELTTRVAVAAAAGAAVAGAAGATGTEEVVEEPAPAGDAEKTEG